MVGQGVGARHVYEYRSGDWDAEFSQKNPGQSPECRAAPRHPFKGVVGWGMGVLGVCSIRLVNIP